MAVTSDSRGRARGGPSAARLTDYWWTVHRRTWKGSIVSSFVTPLLYVLSLGVLLGGYVQSDPAELEGAPSYVAFVAPGMLAAASMQMVFGELSYNVFGRIRWQKTYHAMTATPLGVSDIVQSQIVYMLARVTLAAAVFVVVLAPFGVFASPGGALLALLVQPVVALAFATPVFAFSAWVTSDSAFALLFRLGMLPLFLFSGAFFPIADLGPVWETVARLSPLWHGADLTRMLTLGTLRTGPALAHLAYLLVLGAVGYLLAVRALARKLVR